MLQWQIIYPYWQFLKNLLGEARGNPKKLIGDIFDETDCDRSSAQLNAWRNFNRMVLSYTVGDWDQALKEAEGCKFIMYNRLGPTTVVMYVHSRRCYAIRVTYIVLCAFCTLGGIKGCILFCADISGSSFQNKEKVSAIVGGLLSRKTNLH